jgi:hypothetical protein
MTEPFTTLTERVSLEVEGLMLLLASPICIGLGVYLTFAVGKLIGVLPLLAWFIWFCAWASKGGIPPRF